MRAVRVAVLASGTGTNLQALLDACTGDVPAKIVLVASDNTSAEALEHARARGVATEVISDPSDGDALVQLLEQHDAELVVLAGYMKLVPKSVVRHFAGRMVNIHPALLPAFGGHGMYGLNVHRAVLESGATVSGASVHIVTEEYDAGHIIAQWPVPIAPDDSPESLAARVLEAEHALLPAVVLAAAREGKVVRLIPRDQNFTCTEGSSPITGSLRTTAVRKR